MKYFDTEVRKGMRMMKSQLRIVRFCFLILGICLLVLSSCIVCIERNDFCEISFKVHLIDKQNQECYKDFDSLIEHYGEGKSLSVYTLVPAVKDSMKMQRVGKYIHYMEAQQDTQCLILNYNKFEISGYSSRTKNFFIGTENRISDTLSFVQNGTEMEIFINGVLNQKMNISCTDEKNAERRHEVNLYIVK